MILTGITASPDVSYEINYSAVKLADENATRLSVTLSFFAKNAIRGSVSYRATVGTLTQSATRELIFGETPVAFCTIPNVLIFHDEAGRADAGVSVSATMGSRKLDFSCKLPLDAIDRASRITGVSAAVAGESLKCHWHVTSRAFTHTLTFRARGFERSITPFVLEDDEVTTILQLPLDEIARAITDAKSVQASLTLSSTWGDVAVGEDTREITLSIPVCEETLPSISASVTPLPVSGIEGVFISGKTPLAVSITGEGKLGASVAVCEAFWNGRMIYEPSVLEPTTASGDVPITLRVTDTRGITREEKRTLQFLPYEPPRLVPIAGYTQIAAWRGGDKEGGTSLALTFDARAASITVNGANVNTYRLQCRIRQTGDGAFGDWITLSENSAFGSYVPGVTLSRERSYAVELSCVDRVGERDSITLYIQTEQVCFHLREGGNGAAFGKYAEAERVLEIAPDWTLRVHGSIDDSVTLADTATWARGGEASRCRVQLLQGKRVRVELTTPLANASPRPLAEALVEGRALPTDSVLALCPTSVGGIACVELDTSGTLSLLQLHGTAPCVLQALIEYDVADG